MVAPVVLAEENTHTNQMESSMGIYDCIMDGDKFFKLSQTSMMDSFLQK